MSELEDYRKVARSMIGWFTMADLRAACEHLDSDDSLVYHSYRVKNAIVTETELYERRGPKHKLELRRKL